MDGMMHHSGMMSPFPDEAAFDVTVMPHNVSFMNDHMRMMHMSFFWGKNAIVLFTGWPGSRTGMYVLALIMVFVLALLVEWLSHSRLIKSETNNVVVGLLQTLMHTIRMGLAYMLMLAIMSFNVGIFLVGHALGFLLFASSFFRPYQKPHHGNPPISLP